MDSGVDASLFTYCLAVCVDVPVGFNSINM